MRSSFQPCIVAIAAALACSAQAQSIDQFDVRREGNNAVLQLRFANEIRFQRAFSTSSGDLTLIFYSLISTTNSELRTNQGLRLGAVQGLPEMNLFDEPERGERDRRLQMRTIEAARITVRAGQGNRSIEIVIEGQGAAVLGAPGDAPATRADACGDAGHRRRQRRHTGHTARERPPIRHRAAVVCGPHPDARSAGAARPAELRLVHGANAWSTASRATRCTSGTSPRARRPRRCCNSCRRFRRQASSPWCLPVPRAPSPPRP